MTWVVELAHSGSLFRMHIRMKNLSNNPKSVEWFPIWTASRNVLGGVERVRWWKSLSFYQEELPCTQDLELNLSSRLHSSDDIQDGVNPYWMLAGPKGRLYFGIEWCGGWKARLTGAENGISFSICLPPEETQLVLEPGESIDGPIVYVFATQETQDTTARRDWMIQRMDLARKLYPAPEPSFPLVWNHWYSIRFAVDADFLRRQVDHLASFGFDAFVVDAGWYEKVGQWIPAAEKFQPGEFESILRSAKKQVNRVGIWTCPQFVSMQDGQIPPEVDQPVFYRKFIDGYLLDFVGCDFTTLLRTHVAFLRDRYKIDWWKYDQDLFVDHTRAGVMKNVIAFQDALKAVRKDHPGLFIENCQSGGRMTNELTLLACQTQWLRDGGNNGLEHARQNIDVALGAMEFVFPWEACRWTNNISRMDSEDEELIRFYCRSAMAGTWGIVDDLPELSEQHRKVIFKEIQDYRRLNAIKFDCLYNLILPKEKADYAGVVFYDAQGTKAGILLYRWDGDASIRDRLPLQFLDSGKRYRIENVDTNWIGIGEGGDLITEGLHVFMESDQLSVMYFVEATE
ncbi:MAG: alpha-galactosidase [bacterium]